MPHDWILDVLQDLRRYSLLNDMPRLGEELDSLIPVAAREIGAKDAQAPSLREM